MAEVFYLTTIMFLKISLGLFFLRVVLKKWQRKVVYATMFLSTIINIYHAIFLIFSCGSPQHYLERTIQMKCVRKSVELGLAYEQAAITTITDFVFALLPLPLLWNASMDRRSKISVGCILGLGTLYVAPLTPFPRAPRLCPKVKHGSDKCYAEEAYFRLFGLNI